MKPTIEELNRDVIQLGCMVLLLTFVFVLSAVLFGPDLIRLHKDNRNQPKIEKQE